jgi:hypothetical protein
VLANLLDNAEHHATSKVTVTLRADTVRDAGGTGLGMAIARQIAHAHQGTLTIQDSERGARFVLRLPVCDRAVPPPPPPRPGPFPGGPRPRSVSHPRGNSGFCATVLGGLNRLASCGAPGDKCSRD